MALTKVQSEMSNATAPAFSAYASTGTSMAHSTWVKITFDSESFDTNSNFDKDTNYRFQPTVAGYYQINGGFEISNLYASPAYAIAQLYKNGSSVAIGSNGFSLNASYLRSYVSTLVYLNGTTDYVEIYGIQTTGGTVTSNNAAASYFNGALMRPA